MFANKHTKMDFGLKMIFFVITYIHKINPLDDKDMEIINECKKLENPSDFDVQQFLDHKETSGPNAYCFAACVYEKLGVVQNGTIQFDVLTTKILKEHKLNAKTEAPINKIIAECKVVSHPNRCEQASHLKDCINKSSLFHGKYLNDHGVFF